MTGILSTNITSPVGLTTADNFAAVRRGEHAMKDLSGWKGIPVRFCAGCFTDEQREALRVPGFSWLESMVIRSVQDALGHCDVDPASPRTLFVLSSTLGNVDELSPAPETDGDFRNFGDSARKVARYFGIVTEPVVVCNACVSGVTAQLLADRRIGLNAAITVAGGLLNVAALAAAARFLPGWVPLAGLSGDLLSTALMVGAYLRRRTADGPAAPQMLS